MDNFDLKKYLVENKVTTNSKMLSEATEAEEIVLKIKNGELRDLATMPADEELAKEVLALLNKPENKDVKVKFDAIAKKSKNKLEEGALKNTLLGALVALSSIAAYNVATPSQDIPGPDIELTDQGQMNRELDGYKDDYKTQHSAMKSAGYDEELMQDLEKFGDGASAQDLSNPAKLLQALKRHDVNSANYGDFSK